MGDDKPASPYRRPPGAGAGDPDDRRATRIRVVLRLAALYTSLGRAREARALHLRALGLVDPASDEALHLRQLLDATE